MSTLFSLALSHVPQKTWTKTKQFMIKERPDDLWEKHYVRRKENDCRGYQSVIGEKYKAIGDEVILDTCDLVLSAMSKCLDPAVITIGFSENLVYLCLFMYDSSSDLLQIIPVLTKQCFTEYVKFVFVFLDKKSIIV